jgi:hypothetical protein
MLNKKTVLLTYIASQDIEHEEENIEVLEIDIDTAMKMVETGEIKDGKTIMLLQYMKLNNIL